MRISRSCIFDLFVCNLIQQKENVLIYNCEIKYNFS